MQLAHHAQGFLPHSHFGALAGVKTGVFSCLEFDLLQVKTIQQRFNDALQVKEVHRRALGAIPTGHVPGTHQPNAQAQRLMGQDLAFHWQKDRSEFKQRQARAEFGVMFQQLKHGRHGTAAHSGALRRDWVLEAHVSQPFRRFFVDIDPGFAFG